MQPTPPDTSRGLRARYAERQAQQSQAVVVLAVALVVMLVLWGVGTYLLLAHTPDFGDLNPGPTPSS